jgi:hypothetical protein
MRRFIAVCVVLLASVAAARELKGVNMPEGVTVEGKALKLNGMGVRTKAIFKVYVAGLYVETPSKNAVDLITKDEVHQVKMQLLRDLDKGKLAGGFKEGLQGAAPEKVAAVKDRLEKFCAVIPDLKEGEALVITYVPGKGTTLEGPAGSLVTIEGKDFAQALFTVWLGKKPVDEDLKNGLVGLPP